MPILKTLIDGASKVCGSDAALADRLGVTPQVVSDLRSGRRTITPETAAELADIARADVRESVFEAMIERSKGTRREEVLKAILKKVSAAGVVVMLGFSYSDESKAVTEVTPSTQVCEHSIHRGIWKSLMRLVRRVCHGVGHPIPRNRLSVESFGV